MCKSCSLFVTQLITCIFTFENYGGIAQPNNLVFCISSFANLLFIFYRTLKNLTLFLQSELPVYSSFHITMKNKTFTVHYKRFEIIQLKISRQSETCVLWFSSASEPNVNF